MRIISFIDQPITPIANSQIFSPVNGAQSRLLRVPQTEAHELGEMPHNPQLTNSI
jgi:hypothetical protein